jgi:hypothetical protein
VVVLTRRYACLFFAASQTRAAVPAALVALLGTVVGLSAVNLSDALAAVLAPGQTTTVYWAQTGAIAVYLVVLALLYVGDGAKRGKSH